MTTPRSEVWSSTSHLPTGEVRRELGELARELCVPRWKLRALWRLSERDSGRPEGDVTGSPSSYPYGKVSGLEPDLRVITETGETPYVCCGYCATHMAAWTAREGLSVSMFEEAHAIRSAAGRGHNSGSNATELRNGASSALGVELEAVAVSEVRDRLEAGYAISASLQYADLPDYLRVQGGDFGHGVTLYGYREDDDLVGYFDPLWPQGASGSWTRWRDLEPSLWSDGNHSTTLTRWATGPEEVDVPIQAASGLTTTIRARIRANVTWYEDANLARAAGRFSSDADVFYVGAPIGETGGAAYAVLVNTGVPYNDAVVRPTVVYVAAGDADTYSVPPPETPPGGADADEIRLERDEAWEDAIRHGEPWPNA